ncbi:hypothetical protein NEISICOT_03354 [Neisseria sicca ATCC 29256]|uniref:Uncharacterized protein n=1 Tax=Neisseria sicca ATCC 29256 TaxID=547045 RepID=C6M9X3_NEISI|nr:hypothetical protein NEISICOT_03354 [Neisseria sicca ATCC 29256]
MWDTDGNDSAFLGGTTSIVSNKIPLFVNNSTICLIFKSYF